MHKKQYNINKKSNNLLTFIPLWYTILITLTKQTVNINLLIRERRVIAFAITE